MCLIWPGDDALPHVGAGGGANCTLETAACPSTPATAAGSPRVVEAQHFMYSPAAGTVQRVGVTPPRCAQASCVPAAVDPDAPGTGRGGRGAAATTGRGGARVRCTGQAGVTVERCDASNPLQVWDLQPANGKYAAAPTRTRPSPIDADLCHPSSGLRRVARALRHAIV